MRARRLRRFRSRNAIGFAALTVILALAGILDTRHLSQNGYANIFYAAGVRSMLGSLHNFLFVSFDPGGLVSIDKPPLALWVQVASAKLFGFSQLSLLLPQAIIGVLAVATLYRIVSVRFGQAAGLVSALSLAVFPSFVAISRENGVDPLLLLLMILACGAALRAAETGGLGALCLSGLLVGLAFNTKTLAAYLVVPGIAVAYLLCAPGRLLAQRLPKLMLAGALMAVVSFSWIAIVELTPASRRPFVGSSTDNAELGLTFSYNGFGRVNGEVGGPGRIPTGTGGLAFAPKLRGPARRVPPNGTGLGSQRKEAVHVLRKLHRPAPHRRPPPSPYLPNGRLRNPIAFETNVGPLRLFGTGLGEQGAWMIPFALGGLLALLIAWLTAGRLGTVPRSGISRLDRRDPRLAGLVVFGGWFAVEAFILSTSQGIIHPYYMSGLAAPTSALVGLGALNFATRSAWRMALLAAAVVGTVAAQLLLMRREQFMTGFELVLVAVCAAALLAAGVHRRLLTPAVAALVLALLFVPAMFSATTWRAPVYGTFPAAGPHQASGPGGYGLTPRNEAADAALIRYVRAHDPTKRFALLTVASDTAAPFILQGLSTAALAGYSGTDPAIDAAGLAALVGAREARYVILGGAYSTRGGNQATAAVGRSCRYIPSENWGGQRFRHYGLALFDCAGRAQLLAES